MSQVYRSEADIRREGAREKRAVPVCAILQTATRTILPLLARTIRFAPLATDLTYLVTSSFGEPNLDDLARVPSNIKVMKLIPTSLILIFIKISITGFFVRCTFQNIPSYINRTDL